MEVQFLGTSSGVPTKTRNVSAIALVSDHGGEWYLVDCGEATQHQLLKSPLSPQKLAAIFITHLHGDHCYGLPGLLASVGINGRTQPMTIVAPQAVIDWLLATKDLTQLHLPYELVFIASEGFSQSTVGSFSVSITELSHRVPSYAYTFLEDQVEASLDRDRLSAEGVPQGPLWGKIQSGNDVIHEGKKFIAQDFLTISRKPRKIIVAGDNDEPNLLQDQSEMCDVLVHEATYSRAFSGKAKQYGHSYAQQVAEFAQRCQIPNLLLTHFSSRFQESKLGEYSMADLKVEAEAVYSGNLFLAKDFQRFNLDKLSKLTELAV